MNRYKKTCPAEFSWGIDNFFRRLTQDPSKILKTYIYEGMTVLDLGCGPGFFSIEIAKLLNNTGKVIAADFQEGMLEKIRKKIKGKDIEQRIVAHKCQKDSIDLTEKVDFILTFYMIHEVPSQIKLFTELKSILKPDGQIFISEPRFHVSKKSFDSMISITKSVGLEIKERPKVFFSRTIVLENMK